MSLIKQNIIANFGGKAWTGLMGIIFIPIYIKFLGIEAYGLIGVFSSLMALFGLLRLGLGTTLNREIARLSAIDDKAQEMRNTLRTLEVVFWAIALLGGIIVLFLSSFIAYHWVQADALSPNTIQQAILIMGIAVVLELPFSLYEGGLLGLQKQVLLNIIISSTATLRGVGAILVLWLISPTIEAFFSWQCIISAFRTLIGGLFLWRGLPQTGNFSCFRKSIILRVWRFTAVISGTSILGTLLTQFDKIILSRMLSLEMFGYYSLAWAVAGGLFAFVGPVYRAMFPRFTQLVSINDMDGLKQLYHQGCQLVSIMVLPVAGVLALFAPEILLLWTGNPIIVNHTQLLVKLLIIGVALNCLNNLAYALQLAYAWTRLAFYFNFIYAIVLGPMIYFMTIKFGAVGAAIVWVIVNSGYVFIGNHIMYRRILKGEKWRWYIYDVGLPLLGVVLVAGLGRFLIPEGISTPGMIFYLSIISFLSLISSVLFSSEIRPRIINQLYRLRIRYVC